MLGVSMNSENAYQEFISIFNEYSEKIAVFNEADTRVRVIDSILTKCLGYDNKHISREVSVTSGYIDYQINIEGHCKIVIEAKRAGDYFEIPNDYNKREYKLSGAISEIKNLMNAINQVHSYCIDIGCKFAIVFNGHQIVLFSAITLGKPWRDGYCYIFRSLNDIKDNFTLFWNVLSNENVKHGSLLKYLDKGISKLSFNKVINSIHNRNAILVRNELYTYIRPICDFIFNEMLDEKRIDVLLECYVYGRSSTPKNNEEDKRFYIDKQPHFSNRYKVKEIMERETDAGSYEKEFLQKAYNKESGALFVLLGGVGSGKSTFLLRFYRIILSKYPKVLWFYIDFRTSSINEGEIESFVLSKMLTDWEKKYELGLKQTIDEFGFNVNRDDLKKYFSKLFSLLRNCNYSIALVIDNVDQHDRKFQEKIFISASHLSDVLKIVTTVALREETFITSTKVGVFDAYNIPKFHIASPNFLDIIVKRVNYSIKLVEKDMLIDSVSIPIKDKKKLIEYFKIVLKSLIGHNSQAEQLVNFIDSVSVGNMREALAMFSNFLQSGNINLSEIFDKQKRNGNGSYQLSYHQFLKAIILGEYRYFYQERSNILNLLDFDTSISDSHFNLLRILEFLTRRENKQNSIVGRGYIEINELLYAAEEASIRREVIYDSLKRLLKFKLIESDNLSTTDFETASFMKITPSGKYYLCYLGNIFMYADLVFVDTPISDNSLIEKLKKLAGITELSRRLYRTKVFLEYIEKSESDEFSVHPEYSECEFTSVRFGQKILKNYQDIEANIREKQQILLACEPIEA